MSENEVDCEYITLLPQHVISKIITMAKCDLTIQSTSKEFNAIVADDSKLHNLCTIHTFPNVEKAFIHAALHGKIDILDEIINMDKSMFGPNDVQIIQNSWECWSYNLAISRAIDNSNVRVLSYLLNNDVGFEYRYWDYIRTATFLGNLDIIKIVMQQRNIHHVLLSYIVNFSNVQRKF